MLLCRFVFASVGTDALSHDQHEVLFAASKRHQVLVGVGHQRFLKREGHRDMCYDSDCSDKEGGEQHGAKIHIRATQ